MAQEYYTYLAIIGVVLSFGLYCPAYYLLYKLVPGYKSFKWPGRHLIITNFALCVLAGYGYAKYPSLWWVVLAVIDLFLFGDRFLYLRKEADLYPPKQITQYLLNNPGRILTLSVPRDDTDWEFGKLEFPANAIIPLGIVNITGYDPMILKHYHQITNELQDLPRDEFGQCTIKLQNINQRFLRIMGIKYIFCGRDYKDYGIDIKEFTTVVKTKNGMLLRRNECG